MTTDETLVRLLAELYGWPSASLRPGQRDGAAEVVEGFRENGTIPFAIGGSWRDRESMLSKLLLDGLITLRGSTRDRHAGLTWLGVCRATSLTVGSVEIGKAFVIMRQIADFAQRAGGRDVSPGGAVPEYLLAPSLGTWWKDCSPGKGAMMFTRSKLFDELLPAVCMRWIRVSADCAGRRWYSLTDSGRSALAKPPGLPANLPEPTLTDFYISECDRAWHRACSPRPKDKNELHIPVACSRWWTPREGGAR